MPDRVGLPMQENNISYPRWDDTSFSLFAYPADPRITKDGERVGHSVTRVNLKQNKYETAIVIDELSTGKSTQIENATMPRFSPSGKKLAFVRPSAEGKCSELWLANADATGLKKLAEVKTPLSLEWNSDDRRLLIAYTRNSDDDDFYYDDRAPYWFDKKGFTDGETTVVSVYDSESGANLEELVRKFCTFPEDPVAIWFKDAIVFNSPVERDPFRLADIYLHRDGKDEKIISECSYVALDSDGEKILLLGKERMKSLTEHRYLHLWESGIVQGLTEKLGFENSQGKIGAGGRVYYISLKEGKQTLDVAEPSGLVRPLVSQEAWVTALDVSSDGKVALLMESSDKPPEVYLFDGQLRALTNYNSEVLKLLRPVRAKHFRFESSDGEEIDGWCMNTEKTGGKQVKEPGILMIHGGPKGMYGYGFNFGAQLLVGNGYSVVMINPRGSGGYSEKFAHDVVEKTGLVDYEDIMRGLDHAISNSIVIDPTRLGVTGISYGGYMTNWAITQSDRFKAAISENGISYWFTSYAFSDIGLWLDKEYMGPEPLQNGRYRELSPLFHAEKVNTPLLLIHSLEDYRCPLDQSLMFYNVLKDLGKEAYLLVFKKGAHGHSREGLPRHRAKRYRIILNYFDQKLLKANPGFTLNIEKSELVQGH